MMRISETFTIKGRGTVASTITDGPCPLLGSKVRRLTDGAEWIIRGVERFGTKAGTVGEAGESIGLLLKGGPDFAAGDEIESAP